MSHEADLESFRKLYAQNQAAAAEEPPLESDSAHTITLRDLHRTGAEVYRGGDLGLADSAVSDLLRDSGAFDRLAGDLGGQVDPNQPIGVDLEPGSCADSFRICALTDTLTK